MQSDDLGLVERLRCGVQENAPYSTVAGWNIGGADYLMQEAAAAIERLVAERDEAREALRPLAVLAVPAFRPKGNTGFYSIRFDDITRARQALKDAT